MTTSLFADLPESPSPKLQWLRKHNLSLHVEPNSLKWVVRQDVASHEEEDAAILEACEKLGLTHYSLE